MSLYLSIYEAATACKQCLQHIADLSRSSALAKKSKNKAHDEWAQKKLADFNLWISGSGALAKHSLDEKLAAQPEVAKVLTNLLRLLEFFVGQCVTQAQLSNEDNDEPFKTAAEDLTISSSIGSISNDLSEAMIGVESIINQLVKISVVIHRSGNRVRLERADQTFKAERHSELRDYLRLWIYAKTSNKEAGNLHLNISAPKLTEIQIRLIDANLRRRHRYLYAQKRHKRYAEEIISHIQEQKPSESQSLAEDITTRDTATAQDNRPLPLPQHDRRRPLTETSTVETALDGPIIIPEGTQVSMTVASSTSGKFEYPHLLKVPDRDLLTCPCCCQSLPTYICKGAKWRNHLSGDIAPYTCVLPSCTHPHDLYSSRKEWIDHMQNDHRSSDYWLCFACPDPSQFNQEMEFVQHLKGNHGDTISLDQISMFVSECCCSAPLEIPGCPLCLPIAAGEPGLEAGALLEHIAKHIHEFSLYSLPSVLHEELEQEFLGPVEANAEVDHFAVNSSFTDDSGRKHFADFASSASASDVGQRWPLDRILPWLASHQFSSDWQETFKALNIHDSTFLELGRSRGNFDIVMHQRIYPRLAVQGLSSGVEWDQVRERKEGQRMRRLIREIITGNSSDETSDSLDVEIIQEPLLENLEWEDQLPEPPLTSNDLWDDVYPTSARNNYPEPENDQTLQQMMQNYESKSLDSPPDVKILVAIDFGTIFSGIAYVNSRNPYNRRIITSWGDGTPTGEKVPSVLKYDNGGASGTFRWGFQVPDDEKSHESFKLGLFPEFEASKSAVATMYPSTAASPDDCEDLVIDYLRSLRKHSESHIKANVGSLVFDTIPKEYVITVPGMWSDKAQHRTRVCAELAGMGDWNRIQMVSEPEAAGIYALDTMPEIALRIGETFVVCDAGGGTVDLVSYTIKSLKPSPAIYESAAGTGGLCGSSFLNRIFTKYLQDRMKGHQGWNEDYQEDVLRYFEREVKFRFTGSMDETFSARVLGLADSIQYGIKNRRLEITSRDLQNKIFQPVVKEIMDLVRRQLNTTTTQTIKVKALLLAGGFGQNEYLRKSLQELVGNDIQVQVIQNSITAILQGALIRGLAKMKDVPIHDWRVDLRIARKHYGISCYEAFDPSRHDISKREVHGYTGGYRIKVMRWFVKKGAPIKEGQAQTFGFYYDRPVGEGPLESIGIDIYVCDDSEAPQYKTASVKDFAKLRAELNTIPTELLNKETRFGETFYKLDFDIEMALHSASLTFSCVYGGIKYETVTAEFV